MALFSLAILEIASHERQKDAFYQLDLDVGKSVHHNLTF
jgi:hypothetical protein